MATTQAVNVLTGAAEGTKYNEIGDTSEVWVATMAAAASGDTVLGPSIPNGCYLTDLVIDVDQLDSNATKTAAFEVGYSGAPAAFVASGNTAAQAGGIAYPNVAGTFGYTPAAGNTQIVLTFTAAAATFKAGKIRFKLTYTANP